MATLVSAGLGFCRVDFWPVKAQLGFTRAKACMNEKQPVSFPGWKSALALSNLPPVVKASHTREILTFLHHCKKTRSPATVILIKQWLASREAAANGPARSTGSAQAREALRWFYRTAPKATHAERLREGSRMAGIERRLVSKSCYCNTLRRFCATGNPLHSHALPQRLWNKDRAVGLLIILNNRQPGSPHG